MAPECAPVVFSLARLPGGTWLLETTGGDVGRVFASKDAAITYACAEAEWCSAKSVVIELSERRDESAGGASRNSDARLRRPPATGT